MRWSVETAVENGKDGLGMGNCMVRSWIGWHHHMTECILAHHFLVRVQKQLKGGGCVDHSTSPFIGCFRLVPQTTRSARGDQAHSVHPEAKLRCLPVSSQTHYPTPGRPLKKSRCSTNYLPPTVIWDYAARASCAAPPV